MLCQGSSKKNKVTSVALCESPWMGGDFALDAAAQPLPQLLPAHRDTALAGLYLPSQSNATQHASHAQAHPVIQGTVRRQALGCSSCLTQGRIAL